MAEPIRHEDAWWHQQPDGTWLRFNESTQTWEPQAVQGQSAYAPSQGMSTGAKWAIGLGVAAALLVIVMILAAIAIPVFLRQREKAWIAQVETVLKNASTAEESYLVSNPSYTDSVDDLEAEGLTIPAMVDVTIPEATSNAYCIEATHEEMPGVWSLESGSVRPREGPCL